VDTDSVRIRGYQPADLDDLYRICLLTADSGRDASALYSDPRLPGEIYAAPYGVFEPGLAFVAEDREGVGGYVLGALDTRAFEERLERDWWPQLRLRYPEPPPDEATARSRPEQIARHDIHHPWTGQPELTQRYPSHLHIDLLPRLQGRGLGRRMMDVLIAALRARGSRGVHLFVSRDNERAIAFYRRLGLTQLPEAGVFALDLSGPGGGAAQ
jgi:ribosomal protein S18 acetylase RimI-like enzyme